MISPRVEQNIQDRGFVLGVLRASEMVLKEADGAPIAQRMINELLEGKMKYVMIKKLAKCNKIDIDWKSLDITVAKTD